MSLPEYERIACATRMPPAQAALNIEVIEEGAASGEVAALYDHFRAHFGRPDVPGILKCFATHPPLLRHMMDLSQHLLFSEGALGRKHKEMIAAYVSSQNSCPYCADSHGFFLRVHGGTAEALDALQAGDLGSPELSAAEQALLNFARKVNLNSHQIDREDVKRLLQAGWSELQIAEAIHVTSLFATFNRVANAFGLASQELLALYPGEPAAHSAESAFAERNNS
ncbi:MAG: peroxidase-related enzyme [Terracidiphilus sp.]|jgi:uncharacterized peroxidase-related enzyme